MRGPLVLCLLILSPVKSHQSQPFNLFLLSPSPQFLGRVGVGSSLFPDVLGASPGYLGLRENPKQRPVDLSTQS